MNREQLIQAVKERKPLMWLDMNLVIPKEHKADHGFYSDVHFLNGHINDNETQVYGLHDSFRLATPSDLAKFPSYKGSVEQPWGIQELAYKGSDPLKGSTEEPLTEPSVEGILETMKKLHESEFREIIERLSAYPLEPLHEPSEKEIIAEAIELYGDGKDVEDACRRIGFRDGAGFVIEKFRSRLLPSNPESPSNEWIPVSERLPAERAGWSHSEDVLVMLSNGAIAMGAFRYLNIKEWSVYVHYDDSPTVTHWMPLPSPPTTKD